jgi:CO/xanthine dehydrogenase FAD-binding subunit
MYEPQWESPATTDEVAAILTSAGAEARLIAGGTDLAVQIKRGEVRPQVLVDLGRVEELSHVSAGSGEAPAEIGAIATHAAVAVDHALRARATALAEACRSVGSPQIRARGTIGGNLANGSPAADSAVALLALDATVHVRSGAPMRDRSARVPLECFFEGPGVTVLGHSDFITAVSFDLPEVNARSAYLKVGQRNAMAIAIASAAVIFEPSSGRIRIGLGSVAPTPVRAKAAERLFEAEWRRTRDRVNLIDDVAEAAVEAADPIDDVRASAWYRTDLVRTLTRRALMKVCH